MIQFRPYRILLAEPYTWIFLIFFQPTRFQREFEPPRASFQQRVLMMLRLALPLFLLCYIIVLLVQAILLFLSIFLLFRPMIGQPYISNLFLETAFNLEVSVTRAAAFDMAYVVAAGVIIAVAVGVVVSVAFGMSIGLGAGTAFGLTTSMGIDIALIGSGVSYNRDVAFGIVFGIAFGVAYGLAYSVRVGVPIGLAFGLGIGLAFSIWNGLGMGIWFFVAYLVSFLLGYLCNRSTRLAPSPPYLRMDAGEAENSPEEDI